jgi:DNA-binding GntR family transcriptional regulator
MADEFESPIQNQLRHVIAERMRSAIHANEFKPGEWLRQEQLAQRFGVSHTPVREALQDLVGEGLVEHVPYRGIRVIEFSIADLLDLYTVRAFLEGLAAFYAAQNINTDQLAELKQTNDEIEQQRNRGNWTPYRQLNRRFHRLIYSASRHAYLVRALDQMWSAFPTMLLGNFSKTATTPIPQRAESDKHEHNEILSALESRDGECAKRLMQAHIEESARRIAAVLVANS